MVLQIIPVSDLRRKASSVIEAVQQGEQVVYITQYGRPAVVLMSYEHYETLMAQLEDLSDLASLQAAANEPARPYDQFLAELSLSQVEAGKTPAEETDRPVGRA